MRVAYELCLVCVIHWVWLEIVSKHSPTRLPLLNRFPPTCIYIVGLERPSTVVAPLVRHFINPKLTAIWLDRTENLGAAIKAFGEACPLVTDFYVSWLAHTDIISGLICHWRNMCSIMCQDVGLSVDALYHLSCLRNLLYMAFKLHDAVVDRILATQSSTFALTFLALHDLHISSDSATPMWRLLRHFRVPTVRNFFVLVAVQLRLILCHFS